MNTVGRPVLAATMAMLLTATGFAAPSHADDPVWHNVRYTVSVANPIYADLYYLDQQPDKFSDYSHNPYQFTPNVQADIAPGHPWVHDVSLSQPEEYAMVSVSVGTEPGTPRFHCDLAVDGVVVVSKDGDRGVLCSIRNW